ncbi:MAG: NnrS family protein [Gammaproteobacteria bacterium]
MQGAPPAFLSYPFRPFFLLAAAFSMVAILVWVLILRGMGWESAPTDPLAWHAHEMLFGFGGAAVAGFLLTAVATWTGRRPIAGFELGLLVATWLAGRLVMLLGTDLPGLVVMGGDMLFPALLATFAAREIIGGGSRRNLGLVGVLLVFAGLDVAFHLGRIGVWPGATLPALYLTTHLFLLLITVIGGRIIPAFTGNWLRGRGRQNLPRSIPWVEKLIVPVVILTGIIDTFGAASGMQPRTLSIIVGTFALAAALLHMVRLSGWQGLATGAEPLVTILHVAYAWLPIGYLLLSLGDLGLSLPRSAALHALTMGGVGGMILAVTTRVALGHTGRPLKAGRLTVVAYIVFNIGVLVRILSPLVPVAYFTFIDVAAAAWLVAFGLFLVGYWRALVLPRPDRHT